MIGQNLILGQKSQPIAAFSRHRPVAFFLFFLANEQRRE